ncbi:MAG: hypothetical protein ACREHD_00085, partial [Pirellulales bacterium]
MARNDLTDGAENPYRAPRDYSVATVKLARPWICYVCIHLVSVVGFAIASVGASFEAERRAYLPNLPIVVVYPLSICMY